MAMCWETLCWVEQEGFFKLKIENFVLTHVKSKFFSDILVKKNGQMWTQKKDVGFREN